jgi:hypothetical protein
LGRLDRMALAATIVDPLTTAVPAAWDAFVERERLLPMWRADLLTTAGWCDRHRTSLVLVHRDGDPVALAHAEHPGAVTVCRLAASTNDAGIAFATGLSEAGRREAVRTFERSVGRGRPVAYREVTADALPVIGHGRRFRRAQAPRMVLANEWGDVEGYLRSLAPKWRSQLRKIHREIEADPHVRFAVEPRIAAADAAWLLECVRMRHARRPAPPLPARYLDLLLARPDIDVLTYRDAAGRLLAYALVHDDGDRLLLIAWGARRDTDGGRRNLYFDQYLRLVHRMVHSGRKELVLGKGMTAVKARYGAVPCPLWAVAGWC